MSHFLSDLTFFSTLSLLNVTVFNFTTSSMIFLINFYQSPPLKLLHGVNNKSVEHSKGSLPPYPAI